ncbi:hypothetical protein DXG03_004270 [Asterophora parasitica]|uniref:Auxin efflux carrier n=1 Tax=Asterophora parasitica TaxID=117018 RepID=A0A9P7KAC4_9AGAR|nr:hypothetical protein DXG03_004270 [Asterophora parasitica]
MSVSFTLGWLFGLKKSQRSFAMAAAMFMNSNSLPIALMQSLVVSVPGLKWTKDDNKNAMVGRALTYLVVYSTLGMVLRWSYGVKLLSQADDEPEVAIEVVTETTPLLHANDHLHDHPLHQRHEHNAYLAESDAPSAFHQPPRRRTTYFRSFPNSPIQADASLTPSDASSISSASYDSEDQHLLSPLRLSTQIHSPSHRQAHHRHRHAQGLAHHLKRGLNTFLAFMTVPLWAALLSIAVACVRPVQHLLESHLLAVKGALSGAGNCSIPLTLVVLGAYFYHTPDPSEEKARDTREGQGGGQRVGTSLSTETLVHGVKDFFTFKRHSNSHMYPHSQSRGEDEAENGLAARGYDARKNNTGETKTVVIAVLSRMVITPLLLMPIVALSAKFDWQRVFEDPVFVVANVLLVSSPPALTLAQITQAASGDAFERLISRTIFWSYCVVTPPATIFYVVLGLVVAKL